MNRQLQQRITKLEGTRPPVPKRDWDAYAIAFEQELVAHWGIRGNERQRFEAVLQRLRSETIMDPEIQAEWLPLYEDIRREQLGLPYRYPWQDEAD